MPSLHRRGRAGIIAVAGLAVLAACSPDSGDFSSDAEEFINDDDGEVTERLGVDFTDAECEEPASTDADETFTCIATGDDGNQWMFTATITGGNDYLITAAAPAAPAATDPTTAAG